MVAKMLYLSSPQKVRLQSLQGVFREAYTSQGLTTEPAWSKAEEFPGSSHLNDSGET